MPLSTEFQLQRSIVKMNHPQFSFIQRSYSEPPNKARAIPLWIKISTSKPKCLYYFGSFNNKSEAAALPGYIEDLESERAEGISVEITRSHPRQLTVSEEQF